jgi:hypothetical protein
VLINSELLQVLEISQIKEQLPLKLNKDKVLEPLAPTTSIQVVVNSKETKLLIPNHLALTPKSSNKKSSRI